ncbi:hypothetical protein [Methylobacterium gregans]|uniref:Uncharacterized protein n=1 Tax=Methylobacterium gregans TaxID=374424 RepID=A0AA37M9Z4_9HYPH|nr:hypothetical protein [Methylobacterium gregans]MDQ0523010.1 hypothetical protein [Methylobacterium gregans]GJD77343.1 hypothetical protein NBEOAGPD_0547 [Methylobacterium gregans]
MLGSAGSARGTRTRRPDRTADDADPTGRIDSPDPHPLRRGESALLMRLAL